ncbi:MAG: hypothetical protein SGCHY_000403 [Lobulomycetales sp.]
MALQLLALLYPPPQTPAPTAPSNAPAAVPVMHHPATCDLMGPLGQIQAARQAQHVICFSAWLEQRFDAGLVKVVTRDQWCSFFEFSLQICEDLVNYDDAGSWPVLFDEYVREKRNSLTKAKGNQKLKISRMAMCKRAAELIKHYDLQPHPEGGYYRETYRSTHHLNPSTTRALCTSIYFLSLPGTFSHIHRIRSDELWHYYEGAPLRVFEVSPAGARTTILGRDVARGQVHQHVVPAGHWFGAVLDEGAGDGYAFVGCSVAPGFLFEELELGVRDDLVRQFPMHAGMIEKLSFD